VFLALILAAQVPRLIHHHEEKKVTAELDAFIAELNAKEPGWQLADIEARRAPGPDEENSAKIVLAASKLLPEKWPPEEFADMKHRQSEGKDDWLQKEDIQILLNELRQHDDALAEAMRLKAFSRGRFPFEVNEQGGREVPKHLDDVDRVTNLLTYSAILQAYTRDLNAAVPSSLALLNVSQSLADEPNLVSQTDRMRARLGAIDAIQQALSQGELDEPLLGQFQKKLEEQLDSPLARVGISGYRAAGHLYWTNFLETIAEIRKQPSPIEVAYIAQDPIRVKRCHLYFLTQTSAFLDAASFKEPDQAIRGAQLENANVCQAMALDKDLRAGILWVASCSAFFEKTLKCRAITRCAIAAIAMERYRIKHLRWPESLEALVPEFLKEVPVNPFLGEAISLKFSDDQVMIYAVEADRKFHDGKLRTSLSFTSGVNLGIRLWDPKKRPRPLSSAPVEKSVVQQ
jgi:hypothetical protein